MGIWDNAKRGISTTSASLGTRLQIHRFGIRFISLEEGGSNAGNLCEVGTHDPTQVQQILDFPKTLTNVDDSN